MKHKFSSSPFFAPFLHIISAFNNSLSLKMLTICSRLLCERNDGRVGCETSSLCAHVYICERDAMYKSSSPSSSIFTTTQTQHKMMMMMMLMIWSVRLPVKELLLGANFQLLLNPILYFFADKKNCVQTFFRT